MKYVIVTTAKNEERYIENTLESVCNQILKPEEWIIVDDGSKDKTPEIVEAYRKRYFWIRLLRIDDPVKRRDGGVKLVRIWNLGYSALKTSEYDFLVRLDADLTLPKNYFEMISECFKQNERVGLCGGYIINKFADGKLVRENSPSFHVRGAFKAFRKKSFEEIGGFPNVYNWDGLDELKLLFLGWETRTLPLGVIHHRPTSSSTNRGVKFYFDIGQEYFMDGNDFVISICRSLNIGINSNPRIVSGLIFNFGFLYALLRKREKHVDRDFERFIRAFQYERIRRALKIRRYFSLFNSIL
jgi:glycosyltransferase involved in cell wall biosynthesis